MIKIEIATKDKVSLIHQIIDQSEFQPTTGTTYYPSDGIEVTYLSGMGDNMTANEWIHLGIGIAIGFPFKLLAAWLYDQIKNDRSIRLVINGASIPIDDEKIHDVIKIIYEQNDEKKKP